MKNKKIIVILSSLAGIMAIGLLVYVIYSWYVDNTLNTDSNNFYSVREGYEEHFISYSSIYNQTLPDYSNESIVDSVDVIPGDVVYFSYILDVREDEVSSDKTYNVKHIATSTTDTDYEGFLSNCCIEADSIRVAIMDNQEDGINYLYDSEIAVTNTEKTSFYDSTNGININYSITIPKVETDVTYKDSENVKHICFMVYVPVWYMDNDTNQNASMSTTLSINKTIISL